RAVPAAAPPPPRGAAPPAAIRAGPGAGGAPASPRQQQPAAAASWARLRLAFPAAARAPCALPAARRRAAARAASRLGLHAHTGGIDRPRAAAGCCRDCRGLAARVTGVVSTSIRSPGPHSSPLPSPATVDSLTCAGVLVSSAETDAEEISS